MKLHIPEFHHHDHHKKVITIHHHHHAPKKEHHHHHHHHKPQIPHGHHYSHHHKKVHLKTQTVSKGTGHGHHGHHGSHHKHHGHHGHRGHHGHHHGHHDSPGYGYQYEPPAVPSVSYTPNSIPTYEDDYSPPVPSYDSGIPITSFSAPQAPHVHGISHTVKQVKVFDSLPGALPNKHSGKGYEVTEEGDEGEDAFISLNNIHNTYPATFGYVRAAGSQPTNDPFGVITANGPVQQTHDPFASAPAPTLDGIESFTGSAPGEIFSSSAPTQSHRLPNPAAEYPVTFEEAAFDDPENSFTGSEAEGPSFLSSDENSISNDAPVTFTREAGIQHSTNTGNVETLVY